MFWLNPGEALEPIRELVKKVDFLKLTDEEAQWLFNTTDPTAIATELGSKIKGVLVTAGEKGCWYWLAGNTGERAAFDVTVEDTTGAGDSFTAGILHQLCQQGINCLDDAKTAQSIVEYATAVGALTVMKPGAIAAQPKAENVAEFLKA
jgi:fructokinase